MSKSTFLKGDLPALPIDDVLPELCRAVQDNSTVVLHAPPGAGKTTRVPLALLGQFPASGGRIIMLEPRRVAAVSSALWMATCCGEEVGGAVGYTIRFERQVSSSTRIEVVTEGVLTRMIQNDPELSGIAMVIFDEFHERSLNSDVGLVLCREVQQLRSDLKILVMSATLDLDKLSCFLGNAPVIRSEGRCHPVVIKYDTAHQQKRLVDRMAAAIRSALTETSGDILAFLPGSGEIRTCAALLSESGGTSGNIAICQLYGDLPVSEQQKIIKPAPIRRVILATNIAETSLTIDGVTVVVDSGVTRRLQNDPATGLNRLVTVRESRASAEQRAGRAGRTAPGVCYRLYTQHTFQAMVTYAPPEIAVTDLSGLMLELAAWGVSEPDQLEWLDSPPTASVSAARMLLTELGFIENGALTSLGREAVNVPLHPRLSRLLLRSRELSVQPIGCLVAALLSGKDIFNRSRSLTEFTLGGVDLTERLDVLQRWLRHGDGSTNVDKAAIRAVELTARQLARLVDTRISPQNVDSDILGRLLLAAYPDRIAMRRKDGEGYLLANGRGARLAPHHIIRNGNFLVVVAVADGSQGDAVIHSAETISEELLRDECRQRITKDVEIRWDDRELRVAAERIERLGSLQLTSVMTSAPPDLTSKTVCSAVRSSDLALLDCNDAVRQLQGRIRVVARCFPEQGWPDYSHQGLLENLDQWLMPYLSGVTTARKLASLNIAEILWHGLDYRQQRELDRLAPLAIQVPSGSKIRIDYRDESPILAVKLQELFGLAQGPTLCEGRVPLVLHLLSPAGRPIQVTSDLRGFWDGSYEQVKKEMKGRYPRHPWPDDPWSAEPTRRAKPRS